MGKPLVLKSDIDDSVAVAIDDLKFGRMAACVEAYPVMDSNMASPVVQHYFEDHPLEIITNDGRNIYYSYQNIHRLGSEQNIYLSLEDFTDYLLKEYSHLFMQHTRLRRYYNKDEIKANTFALACEIEACRTQGISHDGVCYLTSATDDLFPCVKKAKYLRQIYQALVEEYGDEIEQFMEGEQGGGAGDQSGDGGDSGDADDGKDVRGETSGRDRDGGRGGDSDNDTTDSGDSDGRGSARRNTLENGGDNRQSEGLKNDGGGEAGSNQRRNNGNEMAHGGGSGQPSQADESRGAKSQQSQGNGDGGKRGGKDQQGDSRLSGSNSGEKLTDKQKQRLRKSLPTKQSKPDIADGDDHFYQDLGYSATGESEERSVDESIDLTYKRWRDKQVRKQLSILKSAIQGEVSRLKHATYARPSRRACVANGLLTKGKKKDLVGQPTILVALDASGSMDTQAVSDLTSCIGNIFDDLGRPKQGCHICMFDTDIIDVKPMRKWKEVVQKYEARGGTSYPCVAKLANELSVDIVIEVGDGAGRLVDNRKTLAQFMNANRKWYDLLVVRDARMLGHVFYNHIHYDKTYGGVERIPLCLHADTAIVLKGLTKKVLT